VIWVDEKKAVSVRLRFHSCRIARSSRATRSKSPYEALVEEFMFRDLLAIVERPASPKRRGEILHALNGKLSCCVGSARRFGWEASVFPVFPGRIRGWRHRSTSMSGDTFDDASPPSIGLVQAGNRLAKCCDKVPGKWYCGLAPSIPQFSFSIFL
jgi:hypothetical protein